jgi:transposase
MAYSTDTRKMVLEYLGKGHSYEEARAELGVGVTTMKEWKKLLNETGSLEKRPLERSSRKFNPNELRAYVSEHPAATLEEIAEHFNGSTSGAFDALEREKITFKKRALVILNEMRESGKHLMKK